MDVTNRHIYVSPKQKFNNNSILQRFTIMKRTRRWMEQNATKCLKTALKITQNREREVAVWKNPCIMKCNDHHPLRADA